MAHMICGISNQYRLNSVSCGAIYARLELLKDSKPKPTNELPSPSSIHFQFLFDHFWTFLDIDSNPNLSCHLLLGKSIFCLSKRWNISPLADYWSLLGNSLLEKWRRRKTLKIPIIHIVGSKRRKYSRCHSAMYCHICDFNRRLSFDIFMFALQMELYRKYSGIFSSKIRILIKNLIGTILWSIKFIILLNSKL